MNVSKSIVWVEDIYTISSRYLYDEYLYIMVTDLIFYSSHKLFISKLLKNL